jgi:hypothetical protein
MQKIKTFESFSQEDFEPTQLQPFHAERPESHDEESHETGAEYENYMFFGNLKTIKRCIDLLLEMDESKVDEILSNGHAWAADHIATSKDDVEEVLDFLLNEVNDSEDKELIQEEPEQY